MIEIVKESPVETEGEHQVLPVPNLDGRYENAALKESSPAVTKETCAYAQRLEWTMKKPIVANISMFLMNSNVNFLACSACAMNF